MLDLTNIQGNILRGYRQPVVAHLFGRIERRDASDWKRFLGALAETLTWATWSQTKPAFSINLGISFAGLDALHEDIAREIAASSRFVPFVKGMPGRARELGDPENRYADWNERHVWVSVHACDERGAEAGITAVRRHAGRLALTQEQPMGRAITKTATSGEVCWHEHFGFRDDISGPFLDGVPPPPNATGGKGEADGVNGRGKYDESSQSWKPIAAGEFFLGETDESGANALTGLSARAEQLLKSGTFAVFRRLYQDVPKFRRYLREHCGSQTPDSLAACLMGRELDGRPLVNPGGDLSNFRYEADQDGARCPLGAHVRRANPRTTGRHRIIRRGITFGPEATSDTDEADRGIWFIAFNSNIEDQFEFLQQHWLEAPVGTVSDARDPIASNARSRAFVVEGDQNVGRLPRVFLDMPSFVSFQGGQYYFVPSRSGLAFLGAPVRSS